MLPDCGGRCACRDELMDLRYERRISDDGKRSLAVFVLLLALTGWADIIEWQDASGVRRFQ